MGIGTVRLYKRRDARAIKITLLHDNQVRVTLPMWVPYRAGLEFVRTRQEWIKSNRRPQVFLQDGSLIGKGHRLRYQTSPIATTVSTRVLAAEVRVVMPSTHTLRDAQVQTAAKRASLRALKQQAQKLLPMRLDELAQKHGLPYASLQIKQLKSRWGSCSPQKHIALNLFLMQLPWELIDYVILHELTHTQVLHHGKDFWSKLEQYLPETKQVRKRLQTYQPAL